MTKYYRHVTCGMTQNEDRVLWIIHILENIPDEIERAHRWNQMVDKMRNYELLRELGKILDSLTIKSYAIIKDDCAVEFPHKNNDAVYKNVGDSRTIPQRRLLSANLTDKGKERVSQFRQDQHDLF